MKIIETAISDVKVLVPQRRADERGFLSETWSRRALEASGLDLSFVQDNHTLSKRRGTVRGLHYQVEPFAQDKLVRVISGAVLDVAVDLRRSSPHFGRHVAVEISADNWSQVLVPRGFAHGFCTLAPATQVLYKVTSHYSPQHDRGLLWSDPELGIDWPVSEEDAVVSDRDRSWPRLSELADVFE